MPWSDYPLRTITLPGDAAPGSPRLVLGPDLPPPLDTYLFAGAADPAVSAIIWYAGITGDDDYSFLAQVVVGAAIAVWFGHVIGGAVVETRPGLPTGQSWNNNVVSGTASTAFYLAGGSATSTDFRVRLPSATGNSYSLPRGFRDMSITDNGIVCTTPGGGAETAVPSAQWDVEGNPTFQNGRIYCAMVQGSYIESTGAGGAVSFIRLRKGQATVVGTQLGLLEVFHPAGFGAFTGGFSVPFFFRNASGADVQTRLSLTINGVIGIGTWSLYGDANFPLIINLFDVCSSTDMSGLGFLPTL